LCCSYSDIVLVVERRRLPAHRAVLSARSAKLARLIREEERASVVGATMELVLADLSFDSAVAMLEFIYTDNLAHPLSPITPGLDRLLLAAEVYALPRLAAMCRFVVTADVRTRVWRRGHVWRVFLQIVADVTHLCRSSKGEVTTGCRKRCWSWYWGWWWCWCRCKWRWR
jgi:hypothetical protein